MPDENLANETVYDSRLSVVSGDGSATAAFIPAASGQVYKVMARINAPNIGAGGAATYEITWVEAGIQIKQDMQATMSNTPVQFNGVIEPDGATSGITYQVIGISGTGTKVNVSLTVERIK